MADDIKDISFIEHLDELRKVLLKILVFFAFSCIPAWFCAPGILTLLIRHVAPAGFKLHYFSLMEPFFTQLKITFALAAIFSFPWGIYCIWKFIEPGLLPEERQAVKTPAIAMIGLAILGTALSGCFIIPLIIRFSLSFAGENLSPLLGIDDFVGIILSVLLGGTLVFQFPVILYFLLWTGVLNVSMIQKRRPHIIVLIFILAAIFSPPDVCSQILLAIPAWLLMELTIFIFSRRFKKDNSFDEIYKNADNPPSMEDEP